MLLSPAQLAQTTDFDLVIRHVLAGLGHGIHPGRERGAGVEFSEYRAYTPGDEWRRVDWKLLARADRYYVREAERDSHVAVWLVLDASASMGEASLQHKQVDKLWFARTVLACVAAIAQRQGDAFGLLVCSGGRVQFTPASRGPRQLQRVFAALAKARPEGQLPDADSLRASLHFARMPSMVFAASDFLELPSPFTQALVRLRQMHHDVRTLTLSTRAEEDAAFEAGTSYRDPEGAAEVYRFDDAARAAYQRARGAHMEQVRALWRQYDVCAHAATIEQAPVTVLRDWLRKAAPR